MIPFHEFSVFKWPDIEDLSWIDVEMFQFVMGKGVQIDDTMCSDQLSSLNRFVVIYKRMRNI